MLLAPGKELLSGLEPFFGRVSRLYRHQLGDSLSMSTDGDRLAAFHAREQLGETRFGLSRGEFGCASVHNLTFSGRISVKIIRSPAAVKSPRRFRKARELGDVGGLVLDDDLT